MATASPSHHLPPSLPLGQHHGYPSHHLPPSLPQVNTMATEPWSPSTPLPTRSTPWLQPPELGEPCLPFSPSTPPLPTLGQHHGYSLLNWVNHVYPSHHLPPPPYPRSTPWLQPPLGEPCLPFSPSTPPPYPRSTPWLQSPELGEPCLSFSPSTPPPYPRSTPWLQHPELGEPCLSFSPSTPLPTPGQHHGYSLLNWVNHVYPSHHLPPSLP